MPQDPYAAFGPPVKPPATGKVDPYEAFGAPVAPPKPVANTTPASPQPSLTDVLTQPTEKTDKEYLGYTGPAGVAGATIHGLNNVAEGVKTAGRSMWDMITKPPQGAAEGIASAVGGPAGLIGARTVKSVADVAKQVPEIPGAVRDINSTPGSGMRYADAAQDTAAQGAGQALLSLAGEGSGKIIGAAQRHFAPPTANLVEGVYSKPGSQVAASLRSNARFDVPAAASDAHPAIAEGLADRGITAADFKGRNGPQALQSGIDNALDIHEARAKSVIDPIRGEVVDPKVLADNPELASRFTDKSGALRDKITYGDLDAERIKMNKELRRANFYSKDPSAQYAAADPLANTEAAVTQARDAVYGKAQDVTGYDLRPLKYTESNLIKLGDLAETTKNSLVAKDAVHQSTPALAKTAGAVKSVIGAKMNPLGVLSSYEPTWRSPIADFNRNMRSVFADVKPSVASRSVTFPKYDLNLTPPHPGNVGPTPMQNLLDFSREAHINTPEASNGPVHFPEKNMPLTPPPPGEVGPTPLQNILDFSREAHPTSEPNLPKSLGAAAATPDVSELPQSLRKGAGLERRATSRTAPMSAAELEDAIKLRKNITTPFDQTDGAMDTINADKSMPRHPGAKPTLTADGEVSWPDSYKNPPKGGGGNYNESQLDQLKRRMGLTPNGSGESSASAEALSRQASEKAAGTKRVVVDTRSGNERPLIGPDAVDYRPKAHESVEFRGGQRDGEIIEQGDQARTYKRKVQ